MTEKMTIDENGQGKISFQVDGSSMIQMMSDLNKDKKSERRVDTIIRFKDILEEKRDSIEKLPEDKKVALKKLENFKMRTLVDPEKMEMKFEMFTDFKSVDDLDNLLNSFQDGYKLSSKRSGKLPNNKALSNKQEPVTKVNYYYKKNKFKRTTEILDEKKLKQQTDSLGNAKIMFASSKYKLEYTFSKPVKSVSVEGVYFSDDRKTITIEKGLIDYLINPKILDFTLELEK